MGLNPKGRNWSDEVNWDSLGKFYAAFIISWTVFLYSGVAWLVWKRGLPFIRIRNLPLAITAVSFLHVYLVKIFLAYTTNGNFSCGAEYWIMGIYLPFGIALFQANLAQLRSISERQGRLFNQSADTVTDTKISTVNRLWKRWQNFSHLHKTYIFIGAGMAVQLVITGVLYASTPTLQGDWSSYGKLSHAKGQALCRRSPEWAPTAFWQLFYSWCYGPYILYKIRNIHDIHHWRLQVILSVLSGLPGAPLWLAAVFSKGAFKQVNRRWVPPMWLAPGIIVMQFVTVFFPVYESIKSRRDMRNTLSVIQDWEDSRNKLVGSSDGPSFEKRSSLSVNSNVSSARQAQMHSMAGLDTALSVNPAPLFHFAATKDFTAENINFLLQVKQWRTAYANIPKDDYGKTPTRALENLFAAATEIYVSSVNPRTAEFPINIESKIRTDLDDIFSRAIPSRTTKVRFTSEEEPESASIFSKPPQPPSPPQTMSRDYSSDSADTLFRAKSGINKAVELHGLDQTSEFPHHPGVSPLGKARAKIPRNFDEHVFDAAERSIKYLVLTNTWQKFVRTASISSNGSGQTQWHSGGSFDDKLIVP